MGPLLSVGRIVGQRVARRVEPVGAGVQRLGQLVQLTDRPGYARPIVDVHEEQVERGDELLHDGITLAVQELAGGLEVYALDEAHEDLVCEEGGLTDDEDLGVVLSDLDGRERFLSKGGRAEASDHDQGEERRFHGVKG